MAIAQTLSKKSLQAVLNGKCSRIHLFKRKDDCTKRLVRARENIIGRKTSGNGKWRQEKKGTVEANCRVSGRECSPGSEGDESTWSLTQPNILMPLGFALCTLHTRKNPWWSLEKSAGARWERMGRMDVVSTLLWDDHAFAVHPNALSLCCEYSPVGKIIVFYQPYPSSWVNSGVEIQSHFPAPQHFSCMAFFQRTKFSHNSALSSVTPFFFFFTEFPLKPLPHSSIYGIVTSC